MIKMTQNIQKYTVERFFSYTQLHNLHITVLSGVQIESRQSVSIIDL